MNPIFEQYFIFIFIFIFIFVFVWACPRPVCPTAFICLHKSACFLRVFPSLIHHLIATIIVIINIIIIIIVIINILMIIRCPSTNDLSRSWLVHATWPQAVPKANQVFQHLPMSDNFVIIVNVVGIIIISVFIAIIITASTIKAGGLGMMYMRRAIQVWACAAFRASARGFTLIMLLCSSPS